MMNFSNFGSFNNKWVIPATCKIHAPCFGKNYFAKQVVFKTYEIVDACKKETEFIALYGREDLNLGTLTNLTNGGDGMIGFKFSNSLLRNPQL